MLMNKLLKNVMDLLNHFSLFLRRKRRPDTSRGR
jgi:hypothetical protein